MEYLLKVLAIALAPIVVIFTLIFMLDRNEREPIGILILCFVFGIVIALPVAYIELFLKGYWGIADSGNSFGMTMLYAMVVVALQEEGFKFLVLRLYAFPRKAFNEPYDGIMYAVAISMGFAAIENVMYVGIGGIGVGLVRMFTAVPAHGAFAHLMGYFVGLAKFGSGHFSRSALLVLGLVTAVACHGLYDFFLMYDKESWAIYALVVLATSLVISFFVIRSHRRNSPLRKKA
jgi:protease PrsW